MVVEEQITTHDTTAETHLGEKTSASTIFPPEDWSHAVLDVRAYLSTIDEKRPSLTRAINLPTFPSAKFGFQGLRTSKANPLVTRPASQHFILFLFIHDTASFLSTREQRSRAKRQKPNPVTRVKRRQSPQRIIYIPCAPRRLTRSDASMS